MASPMSMGPQMGGWHGSEGNPPMSHGNGSQQAWPGSEMGEPSLQTRSMGLKVHYTFDKDGRVNCLARYPQPIHTQVVPVDETNTIGVVDLRICVQAVIECSPELAGQENDFTVYAHDYSEPDTPLVGQGMLSWVLDSLNGDPNNAQQKLVTGRVTRNILGVFGGGSRETLEVKLKLTAATKVIRPEPQQGRPVESATTPSAMTPTGASEWNSFIQNNPQIGQPSQPARGASPALSHASQGPPMMGSRESFNQGTQQALPPQDLQRIAPMPVEGSTNPKPAASSRPSSRTSNRPPRRRQPTGRPRGRPRKKPVEGNTSGYEDGTEGEEPAAKKRALTTKVDNKSANNAFGSGPESLRVAASTSGSLRNFRPVGIREEGPAAGSHLQEIPRAPTPVPDGSFAMTARARQLNMRRESTMSQEFNPNQFAPCPDGRGLQMPAQDDGRSPESVVPTPNFSEDSPVDIGSSPPVARTASFIRSSPPPSSPVLPPMPRVQQHPAQLPQDVSFATTDFDDFFADEAIQSAMQESLPNFGLMRDPVEVTDASGVPTQVFHLRGGPQGQSMVHIRNHNNPYPTSTPAAPSESHALPPAYTNPPADQTVPFKALRRPTPPMQGPTPPPTTDAVERPKSPSVTPQLEIKNASVEQAPARAASEAARRASIAGPTLAASPEEPANNAPKAKKARARNNSRTLARSHSAGPGVLATIPASEPVGPSSLSQAATADAGLPRPAGPGALKRSMSMGPSHSIVPASDPPAPTASARSGLMLPVVEPPCPASDAVLPAPSSPPAAGPSKNYVKKHAIKQRLEQAISNGEMPPFCNNCGAIETPTWRKIWAQEKEGVPPEIEFSVEPGKVTAVEILTRDDANKPLTYHLLKKVLGPEEDRASWHEQLLCNPCGIWLTKSKAHRPRDRWDKDAKRLGQERRKRSNTGAGNSRSKKLKLKADGTALPTSEAWLPTDAAGPIEPSSPKFGNAVVSQTEVIVIDSKDDEHDGAKDAGRGAPLGRVQSASNSSDASQLETASKESVDEEMNAELGATRRLLFPSPRKDGVPKVLGELDVNVVQTMDGGLPKQLSQEKENVPIARSQTLDDPHDLEALFRSPAIPRPSTPPPQAKSGAQLGPFKTPTRQTPSHRPITRSVSRSIRSIRSLKTPLRLGPESPTSNRSRPSLTESARRRRSPRNHDSSYGEGLDGMADNDGFFGADEMNYGDKFSMSHLGRFNDMTVTPITQGILDIVNRGDQTSARRLGKNLNDVLSDEDMANMGWFNMFKSPDRNAQLPKTLDNENEESWYNGSADHWDEWMKSASDDFANMQK